MKKPIDVGIAWYRREDYDRLRAMFPDGSVLPDTYEEWLATAQETVVTLASRGLSTRKVYIDAETFPKWCRARGYKMDARARSNYAAEFEVPRRR